MKNQDKKAKLIARTLDQTQLAAVAGGEVQIYLDVYGSNSFSGMNANWFYGGFGFGHTHTRTF